MESDAYYFAQTTLTQFGNESSKIGLGYDVDYFKRQRKSLYGLIALIDGTFTLDEKETAELLSYAKIIKDSFSETITDLIKLRG